MGDEVRDGRDHPRFGIVYYVEVCAREVRELSPSAFRIWILLATYADRSLASWSLSVGRMARDLGIDPRHVRRGLIELEGAGLVTRERRKAPSGGDGWNRYTLRRPPSLAAAPLDTDEGGRGAEFARGAESARRAESARADFAIPGGAESAPHTDQENRSRDQQIPPNPPPSGGRAERRRTEALDSLERWRTGVLAERARELVRNLELYQPGRAEYPAEPRDDLPALELAAQLAAADPTVGELWADALARTRTEHAIQRDQIEAEYQAAARRRRPRIPARAT
jgi:DNA-binding transcriptional ArsR family regulator